MSLQRRHHRYPIALPLHIHTEDKPSSFSVTRNASVGGVMMGVSHPLALGQEVTMTLRLEEFNDELKVEGRVVWVQRNNDAEIALWRYLAGVQFSKPCGALATVLEQRTEPVQA